ncbi:GvpL/GvpF family gas vesicle protein [Streptomyces fenghuangensis]|uniref:GvpL/GvpF family gas vesicle protein n=1 Tax=Streptomyces sp. ICN903 TaxID=2964654 RepID=UPI001EDBF9D3|nr:GvpL/GvpF family gas vesicle protein [Streptomyces sp. ICN903]MCG3041274.1 GvpL/GvpF family gas vesicle protein [Streptomyces sp. ICN903]
MSVYVYGIARSDHPALPEKAPGVGRPPREVRIVREGDLAAIVSDCPDDLRPKRRDLLAHQQVLTEVGARGPVLPLRFGSLSDDEEAVRGVLADHAAHYIRQLEELDGRSEYNVKAVHREDEVLRLVLSQDTEARSLAERNRAAGGGSHEDKLRLGELVANAVREREAEDARLIEETLAPLAQRYVPGPEGSGWLANLSFLLGRDRSEEFTAAVEELGRANPHLDIRATGPLPPYSFVGRPDEAGRTARAAGSPAG